MEQLNTHQAGKIYRGTIDEVFSHRNEIPISAMVELKVFDEEPEAIAKPNGNIPVIDAKNAAAIAYFQRRLKEEATSDPEEIRKAEEELAEFKRNMNANREATGERLVYP